MKTAENGFGNAQFQEQFGSNSFLHPRVLGPRHLSNQFLKADRNPGPATSLRFPTPTQPESLTVPAHERFRSHDDEELSPVDQLRKHDQHDSGGIVQASWLAFRST